MSDESRVEQLVQRLKRHPFIAALLISAAVIAGLAQFADSVNKIWTIIENRISPPPSKSRIAAQLAAAREIKGQAVPLMNMISRAAFPLSQGRLEAGRDAQELLDRWVMTFDGVLPKEAMSDLQELHSRFSDWRRNGGEGDTPGAMIEGPTAPLARLLHALDHLEKQSLDSKSS